MFSKHFSASYFDLNGSVTESFALIKIVYLSYSYFRAVSSEPVNNFILSVIKTLLNIFVHFSARTFLRHICIIFYSDADYEFNRCYFGQMYNFGTNIAS